MFLISWLRDLFLRRNRKNYRPLEPLPVILGAVNRFTSNKTRRHRRREELAKCSRRYNLNHNCY